MTETYNPDAVIEQMKSGGVTAPAPASVPTPQVMSREAAPLDQSDAII